MSRQKNQHVIVGNASEIEQENIKEKYDKLKNSHEELLRALRPFATAYKQTLKPSKYPIAPGANGMTFGQQYLEKAFKAITNAEGK